jgi:hypothetical protein
MGAKISNCSKLDQMAITHTNIFHCKTLQIRIFGLKICRLATLVSAGIYLDKYLY